MKKKKQEKKLLRVISLEGKSVAIIANLQPRKMFGLESNVMILAAEDDKTVSILLPDRPAVRVPEHHAGRLVLQVEEVELPAEAAQWPAERRHRPG
jgi:tRNA-binding EMAP/Myf-like protein